MNTSGIIRGYMAKNMSPEDFIEVVVRALSTEFEEELRLIGVNNEFEIIMKDYSIIMSKELIDKIKSPYGVDRYILEEFKKQGFVFDRNRSQYIQYCFGNYAGGKMTVS